MGSSYRKAASCGQGRNGEKMKNNSWVQRGGEEEKEGIGAHGSREREAAVLGRLDPFAALLRGGDIKEDSYASDSPSQVRERAV